MIRQQAALIFMHISIYCVIFEFICKIKKKGINLRGSEGSTGGIRVRKGKKENDIIFKSIFKRWGQLGRNYWEVLQISREKEK